MDMLRFTKFTIGWAWTSDYGSPEDPTDFRAMYAYSPYHNAKPGTKYPATMVTTADHDDRVFPAHSFKYTAAMQYAQVLQRSHRQSVRGLVGCVQPHPRHRALEVGSHGRDCGFQINP